MVKDKRLILFSKICVKNQSIRALTKSETGV